MTGILDQESQARIVDGICHEARMVAASIHSAVAAHQAPSAVYRPSMRIDGDRWCALYGDNLQDGVAGFGLSPADAMQDFDRAWNTKLTVKDAPMTAIDLQPGEHYAGVILASDGTVAHHLVLLPGEAESVSWADAKSWAQQQQQGGKLPSRAEQSLLFANLKGQFNPEWYWSSQAHESGGSYAWYQDFGYGGQGNRRKSYGGRARAVRLIPITSQEPKP